LQQTEIKHEKKFPKKYYMVSIKADVYADLKNVNQMGGNICTFCKL
jgi:hypothetical protein